MTIGIITEDKNDYDALRNLINNISPESFETIGAFDRGKSAIIHQKKEFCNKLLNLRCDVVLIVRDSDGAPKDQITSELRGAYNDTPVSSIVSICIAVQELESWLLADINSIKTFYNLPANSRATLCNNLDDLQNPKEYLEQYIEKHSRGSQIYLTGHMKRITPIIDIDTAMSYSNSFAHFVKTVRGLLT